MRQTKRILATAIFLTASCALIAVAAANESPADRLWNEQLRYSFFEDRPISESGDVVYLQAPKVAEDPTIVPISIYSMFPQSDDRYIKRITLLIDKNPVPLAGRFTFFPNSGRADVTMRIRINEVSQVRAVAELNDGSLHMASQVVQASGGCSAPAAADLESALTRLGKMKLRVATQTLADKPRSTRLQISHPNLTGLPMSQSAGNYVPANYVKSVKVRYDGELVFAAETDVSISADPAFEFYIKPSGDGELVAEITDNNGQAFTKSIGVDGVQNTN